MPDCPKPSSTPIGIAGTGRVARALGRLLRESGAPLVCIAGRSAARSRDAADFIGPPVTAVEFRELPRVARRILICVPDAAIDLVAASLEMMGGIAMHTSGSRGPEALDALRRRSVACGAIHPLQTFPEGAGSSALHGISFAATGDDAALEWAAEIAAAGRGKLLRIPAGARPLYHAAAVMASNYLAALLSAAQELMCAAGVGREAALQALAPLARASLDNSLRLGPVEALTGPIERGDAATVAAHWKALAPVPGAVRELYRAAGLQTLAMARVRGLTPARAGEIERMFREE